MAKISIVTGTLNRRHILPIIIKNTVMSHPDIELVLVDGGSVDGTQDFIRTFSHQRIKFIPVGHRSSYPHFMNLGIKASSGEWVCQWNDDVCLVNKWDEVFRLLNEPFDAFVFVWRNGNITRRSPHGKWIHYCDWKNEMVMNYGLYRKDIFRKIGMYNLAYQYYCADGDMLYRAWKQGYRIKVCEDIKVVCKEHEPKQALHIPQDFNEYDKRHQTYQDGRLPEGLEYLQ
jgi:glycosyltransferase involved in cell wall biosynthesis